GAAAFHELGTVVQDEERSVRVAGAPKRLRGPGELVGGELLVAELHDVDAAAQCRIQQRRGIFAVRPRLEHEIEPGAGEPRAAGCAVHDAAAYRPVRG